MLVKTKNELPARQLTLIHECEQRLCQGDSAWVPFFSFVAYGAMSFSTTLVALFRRTLPPPQHWRHGLNRGSVGGRGEKGGGVHIP